MLINEQCQGHTVPVLNRLFAIGTCNCSVDSGGGGVDVTVAVFFVHQLLVVRVSVRHCDGHETITLVELVHEFLTTWQLHFHRLQKIKLLKVLLALTWQHCSLLWGFISLFSMNMLERLAKCGCAVRIFPSIFIKNLNVCVCEINTFPSSS